MGNYNSLRIEFNKELQKFAKINEENKLKINELEQKFKAQNKVQQINQIKKKIEKQIKDLNELNLEFEKDNSEFDVKIRKINQKIAKYDNEKKKIQKELNLLNERKEKYEQLKMNSDEDELLRITNEINKNTKKENKLIDIISNLDGQLDSIGKNRKEYYLKLEKRKKNIEEVNEEIKNSINNISKNHSYKISLTEMSPKKLNTYRENYSKTLSNEYTVLLEHKNEELEETIMRKDNEIKELTKKFQAVNEKCKKLQKIKK